MLQLNFNWEVFMIPKSKKSRGRPKLEPTKVIRVPVACLDYINEIISIYKGLSNPSSPSSPSNLSNDLKKGETEK
jgi:hypothetical protein